MNAALVPGCVGREAEEGPSSVRPFTLGPLSQSGTQVAMAGEGLRAGPGSGLPGGFR